MERIVTEEIGEEMIKRVDVFRDLLARTPVDELEVRSGPVSFFESMKSPGSMPSCAISFRHVVEAGSVKTRLIPKLLAALNAQPERVMFPKADAR